MVPVSSRVVDVLFIFGEGGVVLRPLPTSIWMVFYTRLSKHNARRAKMLQKRVISKRTIVIVLVVMQRP